MKALSGHLLLTLKEKSSKRPIFSQCSKHYRDKEFYCVEDQVLLCHVCVFDDHKPHNTISAFKYADGLRDDLKCCVAPLQNRELLDIIERDVIQDRSKNGEELVALTERMRILEGKIYQNNIDLKQITERQEKVKTSEVVLIKSIEDLDVMELLDKDKVEVMKRRIQVVVEQVFPEKVNEEKERREQERKEQESKEMKKSLSGHPYDSHGLGGIIFTTTALVPVEITSLAVTSREAGHWKIVVRRIDGSTRYNISSWPTVIPESSFCFPSHTPMEVWKGKLCLLKGQSVSWAIVNELVFESQIVLSSKNKTTVQDEGICISTGDLLNHSTLLPSPYSILSSQGFIGKIDYKYLWNY